jgi:hypothetical protein
MLINIILQIINYKRRINSIARTQKDYDKIFQKWIMITVITIPVNNTAATWKCEGLEACPF